MMDFEDAAQRLARDQQKLKGRRNTAVSAKAKREADYRKKQQEKLREERQRKQNQEQFIQQYMTSCDRCLSVKSLSKEDESLKLNATSIWGEGDKISLPPSVLEFLTQSDTSDEIVGGGPWTFRIGLLNPNYKFPASVILQTMKPTEEAMHEDSDVEDDEHAATSKEAYLDELRHKYISYTHGTVVEFTQEEGHVGLPAPIAAALLDPERRLKELQNFNIPVTRTADPSQVNNETDDDAPMEEDVPDNEKTPGHVAYGAFDVPDWPVEVTLVKLPKGKGCTLTPTKEAIQNGFYNLKDVKLVLEQSLIRTRATLSVGDTVHTWHRGIRFDLNVTHVLPSAFHAVTCINTDIEVEIGTVETEEEKYMDTETGRMTSMNSNPNDGGGHILGSGRVLSSSPVTATPIGSITVPATKSAELLSEPPADQKEGICTIQIRGDGFPPARRRFDVGKARMDDLFAFASSLVGSSSFQLVTRFPRTVYTPSRATLKEAGIQPGQEAFMVEQL